MSQPEMTQFSLRLPEYMKIKLEEEAEKKSVTPAYLIRQILEDFLSGDLRLGLKDQLFVKGIGEMLYLLRGIADQVNPALKDGAKQHAKEVLTKILEQGIT